MNQAHSTRARVALALVAGTVLIKTSGCAPSYPVVVNPLEPWEEELERERRAARESESNTSKAVAARKVGGPDQDEDKGSEHTPFVIALTDIIAFPFRGAGWLAQQMF